MGFVIGDQVIPLPPLTDTSEDGILTATLDHDHLGVLLKADFSGVDLPKIVWRIRFVRLPDQPVRSGADAWPTGELALAYDHEAPTGQASSWTAQAIYQDGTLGPTSLPVSLTLPEIEIGYVWLKSIMDPNLSVRARVIYPISDYTYEARQEYSDVIGSPYPVASYDTWQAAKIDMSFDVATGDDRQALQSCLSSGVILMQSANDIDVDDMYCLAGTITRSRDQTATGVNTPYQTIMITFTEVDRPDPTDAAPFQPGYSWQAVADGYTTFQHVYDVVADYEALATGAT